MNKSKVILKSLLLSLSATFLVAQATAQDSVKVVVGDQDVEVSRSQRVLTKAVEYTTDYIAELQETISFNKGIGAGFGIGISNSRKLFPLSSGDFIVTDETSIPVTFHMDALRRNVGKFGTRFFFEGEATPSVRRFFVAPAVDKRTDESYERITGPENTEVFYGFESGTYDLGAGVRVNAERFARYNQWFSRFSQNITHFPLNAQLADQMAVGEGYAFSFEGAASFGPSVVFNHLTSGNLAYSADFRYLKILKSGKFELIVVKTEGNKLLFSIRQIRTVGDSNFKMTWGAHVGPNLDIILGSDKPGFIPDVPKVLSFERERLDTVEERYNSVYEIDLSNQANREVYNESLSTFDFALLEVFSLKDISKSSNILAKFRGSDLKLLLDMKTKVNVLERNTEIKTLIYKRENNRRRENFVDGTATLEDRSVNVAGGSLIDKESSSSYLWGKELEKFEIKAYEEYGREASTAPDEVVLLARKTTFDNYTEHYQKDFGAAVNRDELSAHVKEFNYFTPNLNDIQIEQHKVDGIRNLETTQGVMEFFITRSDIAQIATYDEEDLKEIVIHIMNERAGLNGDNAFTPQRRQALLSQDTADWSFWFRKDIRGAFRDFILGHRALKQAITASTASERALKSAQALSKMLSFPAIAQSYARIFRYMLDDIGVTPKINIEFRNSYTKMNYKSNMYNEVTDASGGLILEQELNRATDGLSFFDNINYTHLQSVRNNRGSIDVNFWINSKFNGFLKVILKKSLNSDNSVFGDAAEFIVDLSKRTPGQDFSFNLNGNSEAEGLAKWQYDTHGFNKIFIALSFDNKVYDEEVEVK